MGEMTAAQAMQARVRHAPGKLLAGSRRHDRIPGPDHDERRAADRVQPGPRVKVERDLTFCAVARQVWRWSAQIGARDLPGTGNPERTGQAQRPPPSKDPFSPTIAEQTPQVEAEL